MKKTSLLLAAFLLAAGVWLPATACGGPTLVTVPATEVRSDQVRLRDLVSDDHALPLGWGERVVLRAPEPGRAEQYSISAIAYELQQYPDMKDVTLRGTLNTTVRRAVMSVASEQIVQAIEQHVQTHAPWRDSAVQVVCDGLNRVDRLPAGELALGIVATERSAAAPDQYTFKVGFQVDGALVRTLPVAVAVLSYPRDYLVLAIAMSAIVIWRHRANIGRLMRGEEPTFKLGGRRTEEPGQ